MRSKLKQVKKRTAAPSFWPSILIFMLFLCTWDKVPNIRSKQLFLVSLPADGVGHSSGKSSGLGSQVLVLFLGSYVVLEESYNLSEPWVNHLWNKKKSWTGNNNECLFLIRVPVMMWIYIFKIWSYSWRVSRPKWYEGTQGIFTTQNDWTCTISAPSHWLWHRFPLLVYRFRRVACESTSL